MGASLPSMSGGSETSSRELVMLGKIEERARRYTGIGAGTCVAGALLFAGLSSSPVAVLLGVFAVMGGPFLLLWDERMFFGRLGKQAIGIYLALAAFWFIALPLVHGWGVDKVGQMLSWLAVLLGPAFIWMGVKTSRMLSVARSSLSGPTFDVRLEIKVLRGYGGMPSTMPLLWRSDSATPPPLAWFGWQLSEPQLVALDKVPAKVYGAPTKRAVVVVSCPEAVLMGRVKRSHFGAPPAPPKPVSQLMAWLWKPRSLRLP
jgi:hypothetical protein